LLEACPVARCQQVKVKGKAMHKEQLRQARIASGLTQETMAYRLGLSPRHYKRLESGATRISESLARLAQYELT